MAKLITLYQGFHWSSRFRVSGLMPSSFTILYSRRGVLNIFYIFLRDLYISVGKLVPAAVLANTLSSAEKISAC